MTLNETIRLHDLSIGYKLRKATKIIANNINASLYAGQLTCLIGANGIGKSTLLRTIAAFQPPLSGDIFVQNQLITSLSDKQIAKTISVVLTSKPDVMNMNAKEMVGIGRSPYTSFWGVLTKDDENIVEEAIEMVGISHLTNRKIHTLSDGERQKVMIAKALAQQTPIIVLDEPTAFLDYPSKVDTMLLLHRLCKDADKTIFLSTHDLELALQTADKLWLMSQGNISIGTSQDLMNNGTLKSFLEHKGIRFDENTMRITITKDE